MLHTRDLGADEEQNQLSSNEIGVKQIWLAVFVWAFVPHASFPLAGWNCSYVKAFGGAGSIPLIPVVVTVAAVELVPKMIKGIEGEWH
jgi:hypothetical protein